MGWDMVSLSGKKKWECHSPPVDYWMRHSELAWQKKQCNTTHYLLVMGWSDMTRWSGIRRNAMSLTCCWWKRWAAWQNKMCIVTHILVVIGWDRVTMRLPVRIKMQCHSHPVGSHGTRHNDTAWALLTPCWSWMRYNKTAWQKKCSVTHPLMIIG